MTKTDAPSPATNHIKNGLEATTVDFNKPEDLVGQLLDGRFVIEKNLSEAGGDVGGIGVVFLATDSKLMGRRVVVKILNENALKLNDLIRKFQHEKEALIRLDHPGIVKILDSGSLGDGNPFIVMEYVEGNSLRKALQRQAVLPMHVVAHIVYSLLDALGSAHAKSVLHRDVKPENIMLTPVDGDYDRVRLIDFGIARVGESQLAPETEISRAIGTVLYISPEQLIGAPDLRPSADIYSAAIVTYELLTGSLPFKPKTMAEMYYLQQQGIKVKPSSLRNDVPKGAEDLLLSALEFDQAKRPQNAREFGREMARLLRGEPVGYVPASIKDDEFLYSIKTQYYPMMIEDGLPESSRLIQPLPTIVQPARPTGALRPRWLGWIGLAAGVLLATLLASFGLFKYFGSPNSAVLPDPEPTTAGKTYTADLLSYLEVTQKLKDGKPVGEPHKSSGQLTIQTGYKVRTNVRSSAAGYLYIFNESREGDRDPDYYVLFPTKAAERSDSRVSDGQTVTTEWSTVGGETGHEYIWAIWSKDPNPDLDKVAKAFGKQGRIEGSGADFLRTFLTSNASNAADPPVVTEQTRLVRGLTNIVVDKFELKHW